MEFAEDFGQSRKWGEIGENWGKLGKIGKIGKIQISEKTRENRKTIRLPERPPSI